MKRNFPRHSHPRSRQLLLILIDLVCFVCIDAAYYLISLFFESPVSSAEHFTKSSAALIICLFFFRYCFGAYANVWRYANSSAYLVTVISDGAATVVSFAISFIFGLVCGWHIVTVASLFALTTLSSRFVYSVSHKLYKAPAGEKIKVAIVGAGQIGALLAEELLYGKNSHYQPIAFIDKDPAKRGGKVCGIKVYLEDERIIETIKSMPVQEILIALPGLTETSFEDLYELYSQTGLPLKLYDTPVKDVIEKDDSEKKRSIRELQIEDLLFRKTLDINNEAALNFYKNKVIMVTGGGGSIGSEICRQIAKCEPKKLIILDIYENNAYDIEQELVRLYGEKLDLCVEIASVRDKIRLENVFKYHKPQVVFHAAAHKHVPLMEHSSTEAVKNNVFGTYNTADLAEKYGTEKFILISTDKAVNPTNVMGATKRMCEMIIQSKHESKTSFAAVRFGNVLGSNGSVIPLFKKQIENGGPVTITDKRIIRYFMTIPEASQLVMQAGAMAKRGELFVLDMGKPVRIYDLAVNMIKLSGLRPGIDIMIEEIGLRPGEKLFEELLIKSETLSKTENNMIFIEKDTPLSRDDITAIIEDLRASVKLADTEFSSDIIKNALKKAVSTYHDPEEINKNAASSDEMKALAK